MPGGFGGSGFGSSGGGSLYIPPFEPPAPPAVLEPWPSTLPQWVKLEDYEESEPDCIRRTEMDEGEAKQRPMYTIGVFPFMMTICVTRDQVPTFDAFFVDTLDNGALPFAWIHHRTGVIKGYRFVGGNPPKVKADAGGHSYFITMMLEEVI